MFTLLIFLLLVHLYILRLRSTDVLRQTHGVRPRGRRQGALTLVSQRLERLVIDFKQRPPAPPLPLDALAQTPQLHQIFRLALYQRRSRRHDAVQAPRQSIVPLAARRPPLNRDGARARTPLPPPPFPPPRTRDAHTASRIHRHRRHRARTRGRTTPAPRSSRSLAHARAPRPRARSRSRRVRPRASRTRRRPRRRIARARAGHRRRASGSPPGPSNARARARRCLETVSRRTRQHHLFHHIARHIARDDCERSRARGEAWCGRRGRVRGEWTRARDGGVDRGARSWGIDGVRG